MHIRNPVEWSVDQLRLAGHAVESVGRARGLNAPAPAVRRIGVADIRDALARGLEDFAAFRTDVVFLCVVYPLAGLVLARLAFGYDMLPLLFPLASGFALIGPLAAVGLYEMSRRREQGVAQVFFSLDRQGRVINSRVLRSSGASALTARWTSGVPKGGSQWAGSLSPTSPICSARAAMPC